MGNMEMYDILLVVLGIALTVIVFKYGYPLLMNGLFDQNTGASTIENESIIEIKDLIIENQSLLIKNQKIMIDDLLIELKSK